MKEGEEGGLEGRGEERGGDEGRPLVVSLCAAVRCLGSREQPTVVCWRKHISAECAAG